jgi:hypothetical protein
LEARVEHPPIHFEVVEQTLERRLREIGLMPSRSDSCVETGLEYLHLHRGETQVLMLEDEEVFFVSVEFNAIVKHIKWGTAEISDLVGLSASSPGEALARCAEIYMDVTFPALHALFDEKVAAQNNSLKLATLTQPEGRTVNWRVATGQMQLLDENRVAFDTNVSTQPPIALVIDSLCDVLSEPRLHWCKLYMRSSNGKMEFGASIDGGKNPYAEAEMRHKFVATPDSPEGWELRQFFTFIPEGQPDSKMMQDLRTRAAQDIVQEKSHWWPFGKRRSS